MSVEEELKKDHAEMQAAVDSKQKIIDAQVGSGHSVRELSGVGIAGFSVTPHCKSQAPGATVSLRILTTWTFWESGR